MNRQQSSTRARWITRWLWSLRIRARLMLLASVVVGIALIIAGAALALSDRDSWQRALLDRLQLQANIAAKNSAAAVAFDDQKIGEQNLVALGADRAIVAAEIVKADGTRLAHHEFPGRAADSNLIRVSAAIVLDQRIGTLRLWAHTSEMQATLRRQGSILLGVFVVALCIALLVASWLQQFVSRPFNEMLAQIEAQAHQLIESRADLEKKVAARTAELAKALQAAEQAARAKAEFLANMSHEIRTPMNGVIGMLDLVNAEALDADTRSMLETARGAADSLLGIINDVLDFSKIDAGKLTLEKIDVDLRSLVEDVATLFAQQAHAKGIEICCAVHNDVPAVLGGDPTRLRQILVNLIGNAVKFTERGEVFVGVQPRAPTGAVSDLLTLQIVVSDTGIGMSPEAQQHLFQAFAQADSSTTRKYGGTGLGLAIAKRLVDTMGGTIRVKSAPGKGTTFSVFVPLEGRRREGAAATMALHGVKALIVEANPTNRCIFEHYLVPEGVRIESVASSRDGLAVARTAALADTPFDVVLLDYQNPEMDSAAFLRELRADPLIKHMQFIVFGSLGDRTAEAEALEVSAWLTKPVRKAHLHEALAGALGRRTSTGRARVTDTEGAKYPGARVLLVEDNPVNQKVATLLLSTFGIEPRLASDGAQALAAIYAEPFDLVLMDCQMPVQDGYETTRQVRAWEQSRGGSPAAHRSGAGARLAIVAMTANAMEGDRERCLSAGMDDYVAKPIKRDVLAATLARWLRPQGPVQTIAAPEMSASVQTPAEDALDTDVLTELRSVIGVELADVLRTYLKNTPVQLASMTAALEQRDYAVLSRCAHSVKSSSQSLGAMVLGRVAAELEYVTRTNGALSEAERLTAACHAAFRIVEPLVSDAIREMERHASGLTGAPEAPQRFVQGAVPRA